MSTRYKNELERQGQNDSKESAQDKIEIGMKLALSWMNKH